MNKRKAKRMTNILYRLRKKGLVCHTRERVIECGVGDDITMMLGVKRLRDEFHFNIQLNFSNK